MKEKSIAKNAFYNGLRTISSMVFPLITYPYATRVLLQENLGKVNFAQSIVSYFALIAALGISTYAVREGARYRDDKAQIDRFSSQVFTINMLSTVVAYVLLVVLVVLWPRLHGYLALIAVQSVSIIATTIGVDWIYNIYEEYGYITVRTIVVQAVSAVLLFLLVRDSSDYVIYAAITVFANVGANVFNFFRSRRYTRIRVTWDLDLRQHLPPIMVLFGNAVAITVYVNMDVTLLGIMRSDAEVGLYSVAVKVYTIIKSLLNALVTVSLPRLSLLCSDGRGREYNGLLTSILRGLVVAMLPVLTMLFLMSDYVIAIVGGAGYEASVVPLQILCFAAVPSLLAAFVTTSVLLPNHREQDVLRSTIVGALVNLCLNLVFIPRWGMVGASVTTLLAEAAVLLFAAHHARGYCTLGGLRECGVTSACCVAAMLAVHAVVRRVIGFSVAGFFVTGVALVLVCALVLVVRRDSTVMGLLGNRASKGK